jgi:multicomponent K+:H+ antiporter subunit F
MITFALGFTVTCFGLGLLLCFWRILFAPTLADRVLALDTMVINMIALSVLLGIITNSESYFEISILIAMVGFVSTVAFARYALRGNIIE